MKSDCGQSGDVIKTSLRNSCIMCPRDLPDMYTHALRLQTDMYHAG